MKPPTILLVVTKDQKLPELTIKTPEKLVLIVSWFVGLPSDNDVRHGKGAANTCIYPWANSNIFVFGISGQRLRLRSFHGVTLMTC